MNQQFTTREQIIESVNKLFVYVDEQDWDKLKSEVFDHHVLLDMTSMGAEKAENMSSGQICQMWSEAFKGLDAIHHQAGNYIVKVFGDSAEVTAYAIATHYREKAEKGKIREFVGSYDLHLSRVKVGWRIDKFRYNLKYSCGNLELT
jgi:hypothetical protein